MERGVILAVAASIVALVYRAMQPQVVVLARQPGTDAFLDVERHPGTTYDGTLIVRGNAPLAFVNAEAFEHRLAALDSAVPNLRAVILDASGIDDLDATADHSLRRTAGRYAERGITLSVVNVSGRVREVMDASGFSALVGDGRFFATDADAIAHLESGPPE